VRPRYEGSLPIPYGKHKHHSQSQRDRYDELLQKLQEQEKQLQQIKQGGAAPVAAPLPTPTVTQSNQQQAKQESVVVPASPAPIEPAVTAAPAVAEQKLPETVTQIPVILSTPAAAIPAATPPQIITTQLPTSARPTVDPVHHLNQVNKILGNVANGNIVGKREQSGS